MKQPQSSPKVRSRQTELAVVLSDIRAFRKRSNLSQSDYWRLYGISQSGGCRYEQSREPPRPVLLLMALVAMGTVDHDDLLKADAYVDQSVELVDHSIAIQSMAAERTRKNLSDAISALARVEDAGIDGIDQVRDQLNGVLDSLQVQR